MLAAFAKANNENWEKLNGPVTEADMLFAAAKSFDKHFTEKDRLASAHYDVELRDLGTEGRKTLEIFQKIFGDNEADRNIYRALYFSKYARNLVEKNQAMILPDPKKAK